MLYIISLVFIAATLFYLYRRRKVSYFSNAGIKGPEPNFLFGNLLEYRKTPFYELLLKWDKEFGKVFGYYEGPNKNLVIGDPDLIQDVLVKQFSNFHGHKPFPLQRDPDKVDGINMLMARGKRWKRLRTTINPAFTHSKMRQMFPLIDESIDSFVSKMKEKVSQGASKMDVQIFLQRLTLDIICKCAFGVDTNCQTNVDHPFVVCLKKFHDSHTFSTFQAAAVLTLPEIEPIFIKLFEFFNKKPQHNEHLKGIRSQLMQVIEARKKNLEKRHDLLQLLLDSEVCGHKILDEDNLCPMNDNTSLMKGDNTDEETSEQDASKPRYSLKPLTTSEVISQAILFLFAGYETSSTALSYTIYQLAILPEIQTRLQQEVDQVFLSLQSKKYTSLEFYDTIFKLPYLTAVIYEMLRFYPFTATIIHRICLKSKGTYLSNGIYIPEGTNIIPNVYALHFDKEIWNTADPYKFEPERFLQSSGDGIEFTGPPHPFGWLPFGAGPRNCIGQRFAMMIMKSTLAKFIYNFHVTCSDKTERPLQLKVGGTVSPKNGINVSIKARNH